MSGDDLRLHWNEGRAPRRELFAALTGAGPELARRYPENEGAVREALASRLGIETDGLLITAGADDAIDRVLRLWGGQGRSLVVPDPTFQMIPAFARMSGTEIRRVSDMWLQFPLKEVLAAIDSSTGVVAIVSPNNPSGAVASLADIEMVSNELPDGSVLLLDAAYVEFADHDPTEFALSLPNVIVIRTLSKAWGLAGLRVGYAASRPENIRSLAEIGSPYPVSSVALALAAEELHTGEARMTSYTARIREERGRLETILKRLGLEALPSQGNFVFAGTDRAAWIRSALGSIGVQVRVLESWPDGIRVTCPGAEKDFLRLEAALNTVLDPEALLFDMDGVLADVSESYRAAIRETVTSFGDEVTDDEIDARKAAGNANDDWALSRAILSDKGIRKSLTEVVERFEMIYQGSDTRRGLRERERLLATPDLLEGLAQRFALGIVTGRPYADAQRFLEEQGIARFFSTVVAREDAPGKPDPAPVQLALARLGASSAWMLGDTPDDLVAAREAGVLPIAMVPPGAGPRLIEGLLAANPAAVINSPSEIKGYLQ